MTTRRQILQMLALLPAAGLIGCGQQAEVGHDHCRVLTLTDEHECTLCGMTIVRFPGPKGQACLRDGEMLPFCSTGDLISWAWQPESAPAIAALFMHDLSLTGWDDPSDEHWVRATEAWFVLGHDQRGAMGHAPAPFSVKQNAETFAGQHGGRIYTWDELDWDIMREHRG
ncbi:nitrous oxide reductase accessory protein NosL [Wenzhouxiangella sp. AB-CW3]|uniref:nitrous oxide reductase accessory protein NosL n=1 Tax=Wenzhouxiangella sp. AB-CW3 TaxID=2771012 RepID=UPI00168B8956|nr:nitrous oxide reductase accessory protein NosL [Wenzhouxiangella sp. AB-CW3]QOC21920.1 nitrous oxide reductase accessory protein NosL [Wenzhouxiangella sp. AB-CW3]